MQSPNDNPQNKAPLNLLDADFSSFENLDQSLLSIDLEITHQMSESCLPKKTPETLMRSSYHVEDLMNLDFHPNSEPPKFWTSLDRKLEKPKIEANHNNIFHPELSELSKASTTDYYQSGDAKKESPRTENYNLGTIDLLGYCPEEVPLDANQIQIPNPNTQQENIHPRQSPQDPSSQHEERTHSIESHGSLSGAPSKKLKVESLQTSSTACSTSDNPSSSDSIEDPPQAESSHGELNDDETASHIRSGEEQKQDVNEAALNKKRTTKTSFSPHRSAIKTLANSILRYQQNDFLFHWVIEHEVSIKYKVPMKNIETYLEWNVKGSVKNETELFNAVGTAGPQGSSSHFLLKEEAKRATWLVFQIFLGTGGHFERWVDDPINGYQPHSRSEKGKKVNKQSQEYIAKQEEKRQIYKKEGEREKLRKIFENSELSKNPAKGRKKNKEAEKTKPEKKKKEKEEYVIYEGSFLGGVCWDNES